ncbi:unnamed protein product [Thlaspi arvense]|uniref:Uncharacterized protein n=1 Tax=Thlaspi arvense TaxID=13288 RepID=A0AAU9S640_THLAR|nr:unnamed protein product [Thlaspi arvense]
MASLFSIPSYSSYSSSSSAFLSPTLKNTPKCSSFLTPKRTPQFRRPLSVISLLTQESEPPPAVQTFWQWFCDQGVISSKCPVKPAVVPEGLGLIAQRDIAKNEVVLEVPKKYWINPDTVSGSEIGSVCGGLKPWIAVALFLIREKKLKKDDSPWRYYFDILPEYTDSTIYWWV